MPASAHAHSRAPLVCHVPTRVNAVDIVLTSMNLYHACTRMRTHSPRALSLAVTLAGALSVMRAIKAALDPLNILNPGKIATPQ